jgi:hypothetical protein
MSKKKNNTPFLSILANGIIFLGLIALVFWLIFKDQDMEQVMNTAWSANPIFLILAIVLMFGYFSLEAWNVMTLLRSFGEKVTFRKVFRLTMVGFFFCSVTPGASGGQPLEIYYMSREGISGANATLAILIQTCGIQFAVTSLGLICAIFGMHYLSGVVALLFAIGLVINLAALLILLTCIFYTNGLRRFLRHFFGFLWRRGVKKAERWATGAEKALDKYTEGSRYIREHGKEFRNSLYKTLLQMALFYLVPFCIYKAFGLSGYGILSFFVMQSILFVATCGLPIPGAIGASESVFLTLYGAAFGEGMVSSAVLLTRGINFYLFVVVSMVFVFASMFLVKRKLKK